MILITGSNGLLGQKLVFLFSPQNKVIGIDLQSESIFSDPNFHYENQDITNKQLLQSRIKQYNPQIIIHTAAYTDVDGCETNQEKAKLVNFEGTKNLVEICKNKKIKLIFLSTDYIFDGENGPYDEDNPPNPKSYYGLTKLQSEDFIKESGIDFLIIRSNVLYGIGKDTKPNFLTWVIDKLSQNEKIKVVTDQFNNPTLADNLAFAIQEMVERDFSGIYHIAGSEYLSRYDFALRIASKFDFDQNAIFPIQTKDLKQKAPRPLRGGLKIEKAQRILKTTLLSVEEGLDFLKAAE